MHRGLTHFPMVYALFLAYWSNLCVLPVASKCSVYEYRQLRTDLECFCHDVNFRLKFR